MDKVRPICKGAETAMKDRHLRTFRESRKRLPRCESVQAKRSNARRLAKQRKDEMDY
ncbi:MAG TPA: hypothetical protein VK972_01700 [Wenzhouxiangella sp.]|nr:hypothetical protein [Wenzhouxiangella sp.]